jgi:nicotinamidase-related amidase
VDRSTTALVLIDMQEDVVRGRWWTWWPDVDGVLERNELLVAGCRQRGVPVLFTAVEYLADGSNTPQALAGAQPATTEYLVTGTAGVDLVPSLQPRPDELVAVKNLVSAFDARGFSDALDRLGTTSLVVAGLAAEGGVLATVRDGHDRGLEVVVAADACAAFGEDSYRHHLETVFPPLARVLPSEDVLAELG